MAIEFLLVCAALVATLSSARLNRLLVEDLFPPVMWVRIKWDDMTAGTDWNKLFHCHWCMALWTTTPIVLWGWLSGLHISWWIVNLILAISYVNSMVVERDAIPVKDE